MHVRPNLYAYLEIMRDEEDFHWIFIDAICINQQDLEERSAQVSLMGSLYQSVTVVIAWLGEPKALLPGYWKAAQEICDATDEALDLMKPRDSLINHRRSQDFLQVFLTSEHWSRLWIVQEIATAQRVLFRCGLLELAEARLLLFVSASFAALKDKKRVDLSYFADFDKRANQHDRDYVCYSLLQQRSDQLENGSGFQPRHITDVLGSYALQQCIVGRDRIYGLLSLTTSLCKVDHSAASIDVFLQILAENLLEEPLGVDRDKSNLLFQAYEPPESYVAISGSIHGSA